MKLKHIVITTMASLSLFALTPNLHTKANAATWHKGLPKVLYGNWISGYEPAQHTGSKYVRVSVQTSKEDNTFLPFQTMYNKNKKEVEKNQEADMSDYSDQKYKLIGKNTYFITSGVGAHIKPLQKYTVVMHGKKLFTVSASLLVGGAPSKTALHTEYHGQKVTLNKVKASAIPKD